MKRMLHVLLMVFASSTITIASDFPIDFETETTTFEDFDGGASSIIANPQSSDMNTSTNVAQLIKGAGETWAGSKIIRTSTISFTENQVFSMKVFSPKVGANVLFKLEKADDRTVAVERVVATTVANEWEKLSYDFSGSTSDVYTQITIIFDNGTAGDGSADWTFLIDDIEFSPSPIPALTLPINFEEGPYGFIDFDGGTSSVIANPQSSGENTSATVAQIIRNGGATWGGSKLILNEKIDFTNAATFSMKVYSARAGVPVLFKLEGDEQTELSTHTTVANQWETLLWDFTGKPSHTYNTLVFMFDFGTVGDGSANSSFLFDDVELIDQTGGRSQIDLPVTFDDETVNYHLTDFEGASTVLGADPLNAKNNIAITTKPVDGKPWAGTTIGTALGFKSRIPLTNESSKMSVMVYSEKPGLVVRLKVEDHKDVTLTAETDALTTATNAWEKLVFDFNHVAEGTNPFNPNTHFDKASIFFNFGTEGVEGMYYWDDVMFQHATPVSNILLDNIKVYTNQNTLFVKGDDKIVNGNIAIYELSGKMILNQKVTGNNAQISLSKNGVFVLSISDENQNLLKTQKIIIR